MSRLITFQPMHGKAYEFACILQVELRYDTGAMRLHCLDTQVESLGNLTGAKTSSQEVEDVELSIREACEK